MKAEILEVSVVVLAAGHNPTILHPSFLKAEGIVEKDWEAAEGECLTTPPLSVAKFTNGITFAAEMSKLQVTDSQVPPDCRESLVPGLATAYLRALPHVPYTRVGINLTAFIQTHDASNTLIGQFLRDGAWNEAPLELDSMAVTLKYAVLGAMLRVSIDSGTVIAPGPNPRDGMIVKANYHTDLSDRSVLDEAVTAISQFRDRCGDFHDLMKTILEVED